MENNYMFQPGDVLVRSKSALGIIDHFGLYVGNGLVIDNYPERGVTEITLESFLNGRQLERHVQFEGNSFTRNQVVRKAYSMIGMRYHLTEFNCEHFVNVAWGATTKSSQVAAAGTLLLLGFAFWALSKSN